MNNQNTIKPGMTLDMKAKLFAQYYGQKLYHVSPAKEEGDFIDHFALRWINTFEESHLELTPLSDITDEDAIEVAKIINCWYTGMELKTEIHNKQHFGKLYKWCRVFYMYKDEQQIIYNIGDEGISHNKSSAYFEQWTACADYLRSKGYALPWMGYSVEDMVQVGWIKLKGGK